MGFMVFVLLRYNCMARMTEAIKATNSEMGNASQTSRSALASRDRSQATGRTTMIMRRIEISRE